MMNTVETFKEKLRATLSEPNHSSGERSRKIAHTDGSSSFGGGDPRNARRASVTSGSARRARWLRDKIFKYGNPSSVDREDSDVQEKSIKLSGSEKATVEKTDSGFHSQCDQFVPPRLILEDEVKEQKADASNGAKKIANNNEPLNYKHRWKYRGANLGPRRNTCAHLTVPITETDENETETDNDQLSVRRLELKKNYSPSPEPRLRRRHARRGSARSHCSISSDSEGENEEIQNPSAMLNNTSDSGRRKQSIFFASHGVWSEESVRGSFRELSPSITTILDAAWTGQNGTLEQLLELPENLANINFRDTKGRTALHLAAACGHAGTVDLLLRKGAEVDPCDTFEKATPLMCAAACGSLACVEIFLSAGANINAGFELGKTPLHWGVQAGAYDCVKRLLEGGAKQNPAIIFSENPLHVAASTGDAACLQLLLEYGADVSLCKGTNRSTALHIASEEANVACIRLLLNAGAPLEAQDSRGHTPLHVAASADAEATSILLDGGANPNARDRDGHSPLHCCINRGTRAAECLRLLLETTSEINAQDNFGYTPLHLAAVNESSQCVSILLKNGADVTIKTKAGTTALQLLVRKIPDVMRFLVERLDAAVTIHDHEPGDPDCEVKIDFRAVIPNSERTFRTASTKLPERSYYQKPRKETDFLTCVLAAGNKKILAHPLSEAFLTLKWQRVRKFFWASLLFQIALVLLFTVYVVDVYLIKCPAKGIKVVEDPKSKARTPPITLKNLSLAEPTIYNYSTTPPTPLELINPKGTRLKRSASHFSLLSFNPTTIPKTKKRGRNSAEQRLNGNSNSNEDGGGDARFEFGVRSVASSRQPSNSKVIDNEPTSRGGFTESELTNDRADEETLQYKIECHSAESWLTVTWCLLLAFTASMAVKEIFQLLQSPLSYVMSSENWGQWLLIASVLIAAWPSGWPFPDRQPWQYPAAAFGIWIGWGLMLLQVGRFPALGLYVQMLGKVAQNFGMVILGYACLLIAFALAFCVIFPGEPAYFSVPLALLKVLTMMVGEVDYEELFYDPDDPLLYPITAHILHAAFVVMVTIVLMNLLVGLAVSDIQGLQKGAKLNRLSRQTALISRLESFIFSKKLQAILPRSIGLILQRSALLVPTSYNWSYYFRPNDPRDKRVSKELKLASLRIAAARHASRHATFKIHHHTPAVQVPKQQLPVVSNVATDATLRRLEQRLDLMQSQMDQILQCLVLVQTAQVTAKFQLEKGASEFGGT